jgi:hypothetical protein
MRCLVCRQGCVHGRFEGKLCSARCDRIHSVYTEAGTYRFCIECRGLFLALEFDDWRCKDCLALRKRPQSVACDYRVQKEHKR